MEVLATRTAAITFDALEPHGVDLVRTALVDTLGVALAGAGSEGSAILRTAALGDAGSGPSLVLGTSQRVSAVDAGMINGMAAHTLDYDDGNIVMVGHPSALLVPAILALGEEVGASLDGIAVAYAAGYEVIIRVSRGVKTAH